MKCLMICNKSCHYKLCLVTRVFYVNCGIIKMSQNVDDMYAYVSYNYLVTVYMLF